MQAAAPPPEPASIAWHRSRWGERLCYASIAASIALCVTFLLIAIYPPGNVVLDPVFGGDPAMRLLRTTYALLGAPFVETALMAALLYWTRRWLPAVFAILICAAIFTFMHRDGGAINWYVFPGAVVLSYVYLERLKPLHDDPFVVTSMTHWLLNAAMMFMAAVVGGSR